MRCPDGHEVSEGANYCAQCGLKLIGFSGGRIATTAANAEFGPFSPIVAGGIDSFGRNHGTIARAVADRVNELLSHSEIVDVILGFDSTFRTGSILPNDHAEGNKGACRCAKTKYRIFDRVSRGMYRVRDLREINGEVSNSRAFLQNNDLDGTSWELGTQLSSFLSVQDSPIEFFSDWLTSGALSEIQKALPGSPVRVLSGNRGGRYPSIGIELVGQQAWALGFDTNFDFDLNSNSRPTKTPYCGWRGGSSSTGSGAEGRETHRLLKQIFPGNEWLAPDQWWSTYRNLPFTGDGSTILNGAEYREYVVRVFVDSFQTLLRAVQRRPQLEN